MQLCKNRKEEDVYLDPLKLLEENTCLFSHEATVKVLSQFMGYVQEVLEDEHSHRTSARASASPCQCSMHLSSDWCPVSVTTGKTPLQGTVRNI